MQLPERTVIWSSASQSHISCVNYRRGIRVIDSGIVLQHSNVSECSRQDLLVSLPMLSCLSEVGKPDQPWN